MLLLTLNALDIFITLKDDHLKEQLSNKYNLISTMIHEDTHKRLGHGFIDKGSSLISQEFATYSAQVSHKEYSKTTKEFQYQIVGGMAKYLNQTPVNAARGAQIRVEEFNKLIPKNSHYKLQFSVNKIGDFFINIIDNK